MDEKSQKSKFRLNPIDSQAPIPPSKKRWTLNPIDLKNTSPDRSVEGRIEVKAIPSSTLEEIFKSYLGNVIHGAFGECSTVLEDVDVVFVAEQQVVNIGFTVTIRDGLATESIRFGGIVGFDEDSKFLLHYGDLRAETRVAEGHKRIEMSTRSMILGLHDRLLMAGGGPTAYLKLIIAGKLGIVSDTSIKRIFTNESGLAVEIESGVGQNSRESREAGGAEMVVPFEELTEGLGKAIENVLGGLCHVGVFPDESQRDTFGHPRQGKEVEGNTIHLTFNFPSVWLSSSEGGTAKQYYNVYVAIRFNPSPDEGFVTAFGACHVPPDIGQVDIMEEAVRKVFVKKVGESLQNYLKGKNLEALARLKLETNNDLNVEVASDGSITYARLGSSQETRLSGLEQERTAEFLVSFDELSVALREVLSKEYTTEDDTLVLSDINVYRGGKENSITFSFEWTSQKQPRNQWNVKFIVNPTTNGNFEVDQMSVNFSGSGIYQDKKGLLKEKLNFYNEIPDWLTTKLNLIGAKKDLLFQKIVEVRVDGNNGLAVKYEKKVPATSLSTRGRLSLVSSNLNRNLTERRPLSERAPLDVETYVITFEQSRPIILEAVKSSWNAHEGSGYPVELDEGSLTIIPDPKLPADWILTMKVNASVDVQKKGDVVYSLRFKNGRPDFKSATIAFPGIIPSSLEEGILSGVNNRLGKFEQFLMEKLQGTLPPPMQQASPAV